jgi:hypothetical protein
MVPIEARESELGRPGSGPIAWGMGASDVVTDQPLDTARRFVAAFNEIRDGRVAALAVRPYTSDASTGGSGGAQRAAPGAADS